MKIIGLGKAACFLSLLSVAAHGQSLNISYYYDDAVNLNRLQNSVQTELEIDSNHQTVSDKGIQKSTFLVELANNIEKALTSFEAACKRPPVNRCIPPRIPPRPPRGPVVTGQTPTPTPMPIPRRCVPDITPINQKDCVKKNQIIAKNLMLELKKLEQRKIAEKISDEYGKLDQTIEMAKSLSELIKKSKGTIFRPRPIPGPVARPTGGSPGPRGPARTSAPRGGLNVTTGGAQSIEAFRMNIEKGRIPQSSQFTIEGFLSEFNLPLHEGQNCSEVVCINPAYLIDPNKQKLFVQLEMGTKVTEISFKRKPTNISIVLDVSGSMSATDQTEITRIEWAKRSIKKTLEKLNEMDLISIVLFNQNSQVLLAPTLASEKDKILKKISAIRAEGSTNLEAGLRDGFNLISKSFKEGFENRVILISDAGLNAGNTSPEALTRLVSNFAGEDIGLTAIGVGLNFNEKFIHGITMSKGGNYLFVNSGKGLQNYFKQFEFLISPVAYNLKAEATVSGIEAKLVKAYGVPSPKNSSIAKIFDIRTLFLVAPEDGGGTILLEYDL